MSSELQLIKIAIMRLRVRRIRLAVTVIMSSLLFAVLIFMTGITSGLIDQYRKQSEEVYDGKYYVLAVKPSDDAKLRRSVEVIEIARALYKADPDRDQDATNGDPVQYDVVGDTKEPYLAYNNKYAAEAMRRAVPQNIIKPLEDGVEVLPVSSLVAQDGGVQVLNKGKDPLLSGDMRLELFSSSIPQLVPREIVERYIDSSIRIDTDEIPILVSAKIAREVIGSPSAAPPQLLGRGFVACYRDNVTIQMIGALRYGSSDEKSMIPYLLPQDYEGCTPLIVKDKAAAKRQASTTKELRFKIIGLLPNVEQQARGADMTQLFTWPLASYTAQPTIVPIEYFDKDKYSDVLKTDEWVDPTVGTVNQAAYLRFSDPKRMAEYIDKHNCVEEQKDYCSDAQRPYVMSEFITVQNNTKRYETTVNNALRPVLVTIVVLAAVILGSNFVRVVDDARREIAIYYAIGATGSQVYRLFSYYGAAVATMIVTLSFLLGVGAILWASVSLDEVFRGYMQDRLFASSGKTDFTLFHVDIASSLLVVGLIYIMTMVILMGVFILLRRDILRDIYIE